MVKQNIFNGFLKTQGTKIVNDAGDEVLLTGWGLGNWLLCEGYMWMSMGSTRFDRPHRIEKVITELVGAKKAAEFWHNFLGNYITEADIKHMKDLGYNSVRIPFNWRHFFEDEPGLVWKEDGFELIDQCVQWCEKYELYVFLDLHGAPGGQTGANIDDCVDDVPRLFIDSDPWNKALALWEELAKRYKDNPTIGGYDLLNEPIRPAHGDMVCYEHLVPKLIEFYEETIRVIRKHDDKHLISIEGHRWATNARVFDRKYDDNYVIHFHRYACHPERASLDEWLALSEKWNVPLWLGETGENKPEWFSAFFPLSLEYGIGYNLWPYKKMGKDNCPITIKTPTGWEQIIEYSKGGPHPGYAEAQRLLDEYIENIKFANCQLNQSITNHIFRLAPYTIRATDFEERLINEMPGGRGNSSETNFGYRKGFGLKIVEEWQRGENQFAFDTQWDRFLLEINAEEFATYSVNSVATGQKAIFTGIAESGTLVLIEQNGINGQKSEITESGEFLIVIDLLEAERVEVQVKVLNGQIRLRKVDFQ